MRDFILYQPVPFAPGKIRPAENHIGRYTE